MFDIGWPEMAVIMMVAIIVIGPKDLPRMARTIGQWTGKARAMARDFQRSLDDMAREADLDDIKKSIDKVSSPAKMKSSLASSVKDMVDPDDELKEGFTIDDKPAGSGSAPKLAKTQSTKLEKASDAPPTPAAAEAPVVDTAQPDPVSDTKNDA